MKVLHINETRQQIGINTPKYDKINLTLKLIRRDKRDTSSQSRGQLT